ncbi:F-box/WD repeat-containing protein 5 [Schistocerca americana]|uniref:F-box/WD repeat-containing protein 5 n=1 Tax=Schistocerca americana TaxID=7009 RepID=UPI001F4FAF84|nr:F-box/WD repeat-containing protein 5 [Schistocerca americana]
MSDTTDETIDANESQESDDEKWNYIPDTILLHIFQYLTARELLNVGLTCKRWLSVSYDELLWKNLLYSTFKIDRSVGIAPGKSSWLSEYKRLTYHTPLIQTEVLTEHSNQVLHVSFSHDGSLFATCSKDGYVLVWTSSCPAKIKYYHDMKLFCWKYTQYSQFNASDTLLLVSGVHFGSPHSTSGEIAVFSLQDGFALQCRVKNRPYDIFGTWFSDQYLLSGDLHWLAHLVSTSVLWLNKASQEANSEHVPITSKLYAFYNPNSSSIRAIMVANCLAPSPTQVNNSNQQSPMDNIQKSLNNEKRNPYPSTSEMNGSPLLYNGSLEDDPPESLIQVSSCLQANSLEGAFLNWRRRSDIVDYPCSIQYNSDYRRVETQCGRSSYDCSNGSREYGLYESDRDTVDGTDENASENSEASMEAEECMSESDDLAQQPEKYLIFTTGSKTYTPHLIGFKRITSVSFPQKLDPGPSLRERIAARAREKELRNAEVPIPEPNWLDYNEVAHKFDKVDHVIDLHGHIIGMGLSPDHRYLYVNTRPWPRGYVITNPLDPPPIAQEIDIHVIDLVTLKEVGTMLRSHKAYTPNNECFFIFLDVSDEYVASGAEDRHGYLWDRHYGICLAKFPHSDVVSCVAFNPADPEMLVTASDDYTVKVWRSRNKVKSLSLDRSSLQQGIETCDRKRTNLKTRKLL